MAFLTEPEPARGQLDPVLPGIHRIVAANPSPMTYHGTNTYLIEDADGLSVLDPGPDDAAHVAAVLAAGRGRIRRILLSHTHADHLGALPALRAATGAPVAAYARPADAGFIPDIALEDGDTTAGMLALHTPGHAADHLCFVRPDGVMFSADHVMGWSTSVVNPPGGNMGDYFRSLERLMARDDRLYLPGHGPKLPDPLPYVRDLLHHRIARETAIAELLERGPISTQAVVDALYSQVNPTLRRAAERNVVAHLLKLAADGRAAQREGLWAAA